VHFARNNEDTTEMGWAIHPEGLSRMIRFVKGYGLPIFITENGIADGKDEKRGKYLLSHLKEVARERELGANILGYYYWSLIDNFEWIKGFGPRFGLINIDYVTFERNVRESAKLYQSIISRHQEVKTAPCSYELNKF
jgi:beta-glucosidase